MKKYPILILTMLSFVTIAVAQYTPTPLQQQAAPPPPPSNQEEPKKGFDPSRLVFGGMLGASFGNYTFVNVSPQVGYMFNQYITAGAGISYLYNSYTYSNGDKENYNFAGLNLFARVFPVRFLYISAQPEMNYSWGKYKFGSYTNAPDYSLGSEWVPAVLVGGGVVLSPNGRGGMLVGIQYDLIQNSRSPYGTKPYLNISFAF